MILLSLSATTDDRSLSVADVTDVTFTSSPKAKGFLKAIFDVDQLLLHVTTLPLGEGR